MHCRSFRSRNRNLAADCRDLEANNVTWRGKQPRPTATSRCELGRALPALEKFRYRAGLHVTHRFEFTGSLAV
jgi:hypothetical protein